MQGLLVKILSVGSVCRMRWFAPGCRAVDSSEGWLRRLRRRTLNSVTINQPSSAGLHHGDLAETLLAFYRSRAEMKSEDRDQYISYFKMSGQ